MLNQYSRYGLQRQGRSPDGDTAEDQAQGVPLQNGQETEAPGQDSKPDYSGQQGQFQQPNPQMMQNRQAMQQNGQAMAQMPTQPTPQVPPPQQNPAQAPTQQPMMGRYNFQNRNPPNPRQFMNQMGRSFGR